ncbi:IS3 family transposase [Dietzia natronolimnaea]|nr:IS3 family transposase [Dietzia natronolimnaea]
MAPSGYYARKVRPASARSVRDAELRPALRRLWEDNYRVYRTRKLWKASRRAGLKVGRDQVARLMRAEDIAGAVRTKRVRTTRQDPTRIGIRNWSNVTSPQRNRTSCRCEYSSHWGPQLLPLGATDCLHGYCAWGPAAARVGAADFRLRARARDKLQGQMKVPRSTPRSPAGDPRVAARPP